MGITVLGSKVFDLWLQKLKFVILGRFQRPISQKFWGYGKTDPAMTHFRHPTFRWYRICLCVMKTVWGVVRTKWEKASRTDGQTDRQTENNIPFSRGIISTRTCKYPTWSLTWSLWDVYHSSKVNITLVLYEYSTTTSTCIARVRARVHLYSTFTVRVQAHHAYEYVYSTSTSTCTVQ